MTSTSRHRAARARPLLERWADEAETNHDKPTACVAHAYLALLSANTPESDLTAEGVGSFLCSMCYVRNWHGFGLGKDTTMGAQQRMWGAAKASEEEENLDDESRLLRFMQARPFHPKQLHLPL